MDAKAFLEKWYETILSALHSEGAPQACIDRLAAVCPVNPLDKCKTFGGTVRMVAKLLKEGKSKKQIVKWVRFRLHGELLILLATAHNRNPKGGFDQHFPQKEAREIDFPALRRLIAKATSIDEVKHIL